MQLPQPSTSRENRAIWRLESRVLGLLDFATARKSNCQLTGSHIALFCTPCSSVDVISILLSLCLFVSLSAYLFFKPITVVHHLNGSLWQPSLTTHLAQYHNPPRSWRVHQVDCSSIYDWSHDCYKIDGCIAAKVEIRSASWAGSRILVKPGHRTV
jgi:hypothetical protein